MFAKGSSLESIDLSKFNADKVTDMSYMFYDCSSLESIDLTKYNTDKATDISYMFYGSSFKSLDYLYLIQIKLLIWVISSMVLLL